MTRSLAWGTQDNSDGALSWGSQENTPLVNILGSLESTTSDTALTSTGVLGNSIIGSISATPTDVISIASGALTISGNLSEVTSDIGIILNGIRWERVTFNGIAPDDTNFNSVSFYHLAVNDLGFTPEVNDILHYYSLSPEAGGLIVDTQTIPTINPEADLSGEFYFQDVSASTSTARSSFIIDDRIQAELVESLGNATVATSGSITSGVTGSIIRTTQTVVSTAIGEISLLGTLSEVTDVVGLSASGGVGEFLGSLSVTLQGTQSTTSGQVIFEGSLSSQLEDSRLAAGGSIASNPLGNVSTTTDNTTSSSFGEVEFSGAISEITDAAGIVSSGDIFVPGSLSQTTSNVVSIISGTLSISGDLVEALDNVSVDFSATVIQPITGSLSPSTQGTVLASTGSISIVQSLISGVVADMNAWLPANNLLTDAQMETTIVTPIFNKLGVTPENRAQALCESLEAAALLNKAKVATFYGLSSERVDEAEFKYSTGQKTPADLWEDYIQTLPDICRVIGYSRPTTIGISVSSGPAIDPLSRSNKFHNTRARKHCRKTGYLY